MKTSTETGPADLRRTARNREQLIARASWVGIAGNAFLSVIKILTGLMAGSLAVVADGVDSCTDIVISIITLITAKILTRPPNKQYPYGYGKADTVATKALSFIILFAGGQLFITAIKRLIAAEYQGAPSFISVIVTLVSIGGKWFLAGYQLRVGKRTGSNMLIATSKNMKNDILISVSVLLGLVFNYLFHMPVLDTLTGLLVSIWVLRVGYQIFLQTSQELMDGITDCTIYNQIFDAVESVEGAHHPHRVRARYIGHKVMISIDLEVDGDLSLRRAHEISHQVEHSIKTRIENVFDVDIHMEPIGDTNDERALGVNKNNL